MNLLRRLVEQYAHKGFMAFLDPAGAIEEGEVAFAGKKYVFFRASSAIEARKRLEELGNKVRPVPIFKIRLPGLEDWYDAIIQLNPREVIGFVWGKEVPSRPPITPELLGILLEPPQEIPESEVDLARLILERSLGRPVSEEKDLLIWIPENLRVYRDVLLRDADEPIKALVRALDEDRQAIEALPWKALLEEHGIPVSLAALNIHPAGAILEKHLPKGATKLWARLDLKPPPASEVLDKLGDFLKPAWEALQRERLHSGLAQKLALEAVNEVLQNPESVPKASGVSHELLNDETRELLESVLRLAHWLQEPLASLETPEDFAHAWSGVQLLHDRMIVHSRKLIPDNTRIGGFSQQIAKQLSALNEQWFLFIRKNYANWLKRGPGNRPLLVVDVLEAIRRDYREPLYIIVFDGLRWDFWEFAFRGWVQKALLESGYVLHKERVGVSILPSATQYARKALFSGRMPAEQRGTNELKLLADALERMGLVSDSRLIEKSQFAAQAEVNYDDAKEIVTSNLPVKPLVFNISDDTLEDTKGDLFTAISVLETLFNNQVLPTLRQIKPGGAVLIASDHGLIKITEEMAAFEGWSEEGYWNYRYAQLIKNVDELADEEWNTLLLSPEEGRLYKYSKPLNAPVAKWAFPGAETYFERQEGGRKPSGYKHGGISLEEMLIPVAVFLPDDDTFRPKLEIKVEPLTVKQKVKTPLRLMVSNDGLAPARSVRVRWDGDERIVGSIDASASFDWSREVVYDKPGETQVVVEWENPDRSRDKLERAFSVAVETAVERKTGLLDDLMGGNE